MKDLTNKRFGRLLVLERAENDKHGSTKWKCLCDCGKNVNVIRQSLVLGLTKSCGCLNQEKRKSRTKHGLMIKCKELNAMGFYHSYWSMVNRCYNISYKPYEKYGKKGIAVDKDWLGENGLTHFFKDMFSTWENGLTLDRVNNNKGYSKDNCRWATMKIQSNNRKNTIYIIINGEKKSMSEWCDIYNIKYCVVWARRKHGWPEDKWFIPSEKVKN